MLFQQEEKYVYAFDILWYAFLRVVISANQSRIKTVSQHTNPNVRNENIKYPWNMPLRHWGFGINEMKTLNAIIIIFLRESIQTYLFPLDNQIF